VLDPPRADFGLWDKFGASSSHASTTAAGGAGQVNRFYKPPEVEETVAG
jgi:hypothetical protein